MPGTLVQSPPASASRMTVRSASPTITASMPSMVNAPAGSIVG